MWHGASPSRRLASAPPTAPLSASAWGGGFELVVDRVTRIDTATQRVRLAAGRVLDYDHDVDAVGSTAGTPPSVPGATEFAVRLAEFEVAERLRAVVDVLPRDAPVTGVGGVLTGIETAAEPAEGERAVTLVCGRVLAPTFSAGGRRYIAAWLSQHGVAVLEGVSVR
ncbi:FAD-dependent oxidoreductase [Streptomyces sp. NPDC093105]|uniref:FAD-dependent oxidoreductase n=1 Tax=Streptomyces sp. NPDC093105 TaxID=3366029 RepID=UPI003812DB8D